jgi:hypothetical protein
MRYVLHERPEALLGVDWSPPFREESEEQMTE